EYFDRSLGQTNVAQAVGDLVAPNISGVHATNQLGQTVMIWQTFEPADSVIRYGTNPANLDHVLRLSARTPDHELVLTSLAAGSAYYFVVTSMDAAGNTATANNGGQPFIVAAAPTVLLVDDYHYEFPDVFIPLETYTNALVQLEVSFDVWSTEQQGEGPLYANLKDYPVVLWRINDSLHRSSDAIAPAQRAAIQEYVNNGGAFFMASMEI